MSQIVKNLGTGGSALDARLGSASGADSNDPKFLDWDGENYVYLPGVSGNYLSVPDEAALDITGDIDIRVKVALDDWTPAAQATLFSKWNSGGNQKSYALDINTSGKPVFYWSADGAASLSSISTAAVVAADGTPKWLRATLDVDNGAAGRDVKFYTSDDGVSWTQLGSTVTSAGVTSIFSGTSVAVFGGVSGGTVTPTGSLYRAIVKDGIDGTPVLDVDCSQITSGADTSFTALTGQTVTINRSTSGRKSVAVVAPVWLFGTDDYLEVPDNDLLDFGALDSFTVLAIIRRWANAASQAVVAKRDAVGSTPGNQGYALWIASVSVVPRTAFVVDDGTDSAQGLDDTTGLAYGTLGTLIGKLDRSTDLASIQTGTASAVTASSTSVDSVSNSLPLRIGRVSDTGTNYADMEFIAAAIFRRALTADEIKLISDYYASRVP